VLLWGIAGVGKTSLAKKFIYSKFVDGYFTDGTAFINRVSELPSEDVIIELSKRFNVWKDDLSIDTLGSRLNTYFKNHPNALIILDNVSSTNQLEKILNAIGQAKILITSPNYFGQMNPTPTAIGIFADALASTLNQPVAVWQNSPAASAIEKSIIYFFCKIVKFPETAFGTITSGGSQANLTALFLARKFAEKKVGRDSNFSNDRFTFYASDQAHFSFDRFADLMGFAKKNFRRIPVDHQFKIKPEILERQIIKDTKLGLIPICIIGTAGTTNTGSIDPLRSLAELASKYNLWFHVDAAYGGALAVSQRHGHRLTGIEQADSITIDPHKWFFVPFTCGAILVRDGLNLKNAFDNLPAYINNQNSSNDTIDFVRYNIFCSRRFDALKIWMSLMEQGIEEYENTIDRQIELTQYLASLIATSNFYNCLHKPETGILCFTHINDITANQQSIIQLELHSKSARNRNETSESGSLNKKIHADIEKSGSAWISLTKLRNTRVLRANIMSYLTNETHIDSLFKLLQERGENYQNFKC
jgi:aromatic-L-amino-acid decarboxylase